MGAPRLVNVKLLRNHGARVVYQGTRGRVARFVRPDGFLSAPEAAALLGTYRHMIRRMAIAKRLTKRPGRIGSRWVHLPELRAILKLPLRDRATAGAPTPTTGAR